MKRMVVAACMIPWCGAWAAEKADYLAVENAGIRLSVGAAAGCRQIEGTVSKDGKCVKTFRVGARVDAGVTESTGTVSMVDGGLDIVDRFGPVENRPYGTREEKARLRGEGTAIRWKVEVSSGGDPWTAPIEASLSWSDPADSMFWTAWSNPEPDKPGWQDPLTMMPFADRTFYYGAPACTNENPGVGFCPLKGDTFCIPIATIADVKNDVALSLVVSPDNLLLDMTLTTDKAGNVRFSMLNHRIGQNRPVRFTMYLVAHAADWRAGLGWMAAKFPAYFEPVCAVADEIAGCGAYSTHEGELDVRKLFRMGFRVNWKASYDFPYMGMFIPPVKDDSERYPRFLQPKNAPEEVARTSIEQMRTYSENMRKMGFYVLNYFNVTELGTGIRRSAPINPTTDPGNAWKEANDFLYTQIPDGILHRPDGGFWSTWGGAIAMDPGGARYQAHLLDQGRRHIEKLPASSGICIDRLDWLRFYNPDGDDGLSWRAAKPERSLYISWKDLMGKLAPMMHAANKAIFVNNHLKRIDLLRDIDGIYCEFAQNENALNATGLLCVRRPALGWTGTVQDLKPDPDALFQRHLHMGVYPTAPLPGNDHTILPDAWAEKYYLDYGPMLDAMRGKRWVLKPHVLEVESAKANVFGVPGGFVVPVTFGGANESAHVILRGLDTPPGVDSLRTEVLHPGTRTWTPIAVDEKADVLTLTVPLERGCALVRLAYARVQPAETCFTARTTIEMGTALSTGKIHYTLDGNSPTANSALYDGPITVDRNARVKMTVFVDGKERASAAADIVKAPPSPPAIDPAGAVFDGSVQVRLSAPTTETGTEIRYTLDGSDPGPDAQQYSGLIDISATATVKARVFIKNAVPSPMASALFARRPHFPPLPDIFISDLKPVRASVGWGETAKVNRSIQDKPLTITGKPYEKGVGVHAASELVYDLRPAYKTFVATVGVDDEMLNYNLASVVFQVFADEQCLCESPVLREGMYWNLQADMPTGAKQIRLVVTDAGDGINGDHADWVNAGFLKRN